MISISLDDNVTKASFIHFKQGKPTEKYLQLQPFVQHRLTARQKSLLVYSAVFIFTAIA